jgi:hypothetical protein
MQSNAKPKRNNEDSLKVGEYPALRQFIHGYLHEDYVDEYGSAEDAASEFWQDADPEEREQVAAEWQRFLKDTSGASIAAVRRVLSEKFGSGWHFDEKEELDRVSAVLLKRNHH